MPDYPFHPFGGYEHLKTYQLAELIYDATVVFCDRFYRDSPRMREQLVQAARSGSRNLGEGSGAAATSRKSEMLLTNVARASLRDELLPDLEAFLRQRALEVWCVDDPRCLEMRRRLRYSEAPRIRAKHGVVVLRGTENLLQFIARADPEPVANALLCLIHQCTCLIWRQLQGQMKQFENEGGFSEQLYRRRTGR